MVSNIDVSISHKLSEKFVSTEQYRRTRYAASYTLAQCWLNAGPVSPHCPSSEAALVQLHVLAVVISLSNML